MTKDNLNQVLVQDSDFVIGIIDHVLHLDMDEPFLYSQRKTVLQNLILNIRC